METDCYFSDYYININSRPITFWGKCFTIIALFCEFNPSLASINYLQYPVILLLLVFILFGNKIRISIFISWFLCFVLFSIVSLLWSVTIDSVSFSTIAYMIKALLLFFFLSNRKISINWLSLVIVGINVINAIILLVNIDLTAAVVYRARIQHPVIGGVVWGINSVCPMIAEGICISVFLLFNVKKILLKLLHVLLITIQLIPILILGSRQSVFIVALFFLFYIILDDSLRIRLKPRTIILLVGIAVLTVVLLSNELLSITFVSRIKDSINGENASDKERLGLIQIGLEFFTDRPLFGHGLETFHFLMGWESGYSHNTFVEILVGLGSVGFILFHIYIVISAVLFRKAKKNKVLKLGVSLLIVYVFCEFVIVTYISFHLMLLLWLSFSIASDVQETISTDRSGIRELPQRHSNSSSVFLI